MFADKAACLYFILFVGQPTIVLWWHTLDDQHIAIVGTKVIQTVKVNLIITLSLGSTESDSVISELCYNVVAYNSHVIK